MNKIIFTKYSNERAGRFALRTDILSAEQGRIVRKQALYPEGAGHISSILRWYEELGSRYEDSALSLNRCWQKDGSLLFEYLEGRTLEQMLDSCLMAGKREDLTELLFGYLEEVKKGFPLEKFQVTPEFTEVFGDVELPEELLSGDVVDIDMVLNNVVADEGWTLIDYEWTFGFPIPYHFVVYRILTYYLNGNSSRNCLHGLKLYERAGLTEQELKIYEKMERHFQDVYVVSEGKDCGVHVPIRDLYDAISPGEEDLTGLRFQEQSERAAGMVQLYEGADCGFSEECSVRRELTGDGVFDGTFQLSEGTCFVRLDPCSRYCIVSELKVNGREDVRPVRTNGVRTGKAEWFFATEDPQIILDCQGDTAGRLEVFFRVEYLEQEDALDRLNELYARQSHVLRETRAALGQKEALIREMENTKVWKAYRKIKGKQQ